MLQIQAFPFTAADAQSGPAVDDAAFRYAPNRLCAACREVLHLGVAQHRALGARMAHEVWTPYTYGALWASARLGCHVCALLEASPMFGQKEPEPEQPVVLSIHRAASAPGVAPEDSTAFGLKLTGRFSSDSLFVHLGGGEARVVGTGGPEPSLGRWTGDEETFSVARGWLDLCLAEHALCADNGDAARIVRPARLLAVKGTTIRLIDSVDAEGRDYVTLSHCWGTQTYVPQLRHGTEAKFRAGIDFEYLPKTFQDAVTICRKLGYGYIWIDSLCIIQDSKEDWEVQAKIMALVYANSVVTIAALKSPGSHGGCFTSERNPLYLHNARLDDPDVTVTSRISSEMWGVEVNVSGHGAPSPLHTRSWVVQERLSSPRTLLYGAHGVFWECRCAQASEAHYYRVAWDLQSNKKTWLQRLAASPSSTPQASPPSSAAADHTAVSPASRPSWMAHWTDLLRTYSSCALTMQTDKLIAVAGLLSEVERRSQPRKRCVLGLWADGGGEDKDESLLSQTMLWYRARDDNSSPTDPVSRLQNGMPTWTWASVEGCCSCISPGGELEWQTPIEIDVAAVPSTMRLNTWFRKALVDEYNEISLDPDDPKTGQKGWGGDLNESYSWFPDCGVPEGEADLFIVPVQRWRVMDSPPIWVSRCLLITPDPIVYETGPDSGFTRVGLVSVRFSDPRDDPFKSKDDSAREVVYLR